MKTLIIGLDAACLWVLDPLFEAETTPTIARLFDVAPTILASLGVPHDERMDGTVLPVVESVGTRRYEGGELPQPTESAAVEERLSQLGYLE